MNDLLSRCVNDRLRVNANVVVSNDVRRIVTRTRNNDGTVNSVRITLVGRSRIPLKYVVRAQYARVRVRKCTSDLLCDLNDYDLNDRFQRALYRRLLYRRVRRHVVRLLLGDVTSELNRALVRRSQSVNLRPLVERRTADNPVPRATRDTVALRNGFLNGQILGLLLRSTRVVNEGVVLVRVRLVLRVLVTYNEDGTVVDSYVVRNGAQSGKVARVNSIRNNKEGQDLTCLRVRLTVERAVLIGVLVINRGVCIPSSIRLYLRCGLSSDLVVLINSITNVHVSRRSLLYVVRNYCHGHRVIVSAIVVDRLCVTVVSKAVARLRVDALVLGQVTEVSARRSALYILTVRDDLEAARSVGAKDLVVVGVRNELTRRQSTVRVSTCHEAIRPATGTARVRDAKGAATVIERCGVESVAEGLTRVTNA